MLPGRGFQAARSRSRSRITLAPRLQLRFHFKRYVPKMSKIGMAQTVKPLVNPSSPPNIWSFESSQIDQNQKLLAKNLHTPSPGPWLWAGWPAWRHKPLVPFGRWSLNHPAGSIPKSCPLMRIQLPLLLTVPSGNGLPENSPFTGDFPIWLNYRGFWVATFDYQKVYLALSSWLWLVFGGRRLEALPSHWSSCNSQRISCTVVPHKFIMVNNI